MLENKEWKEAHNAEVRLEDMNPVAFKHLLEHLYCGDTSFATADLDLALDILHAADRFLVDSMKSKVRNTHLYFSCDRPSRVVPTLCHSANTSCSRC
jgi:hypothetical protein